MPITMPGLTTQNLDIKGIIKKLVKIKSAPIERLEKEIERYNLQKDIWKSIRKKLRNLSRLATRMYDYTNPFRIMEAKSSNSDSFTATTGRKAKKGIRKVQVLQVAAAHRIASDSQPKEKKLTGSVFTIKVGKIEKKINFEYGGSLKELAEMIERVAREQVKVVLTFDTSKTAILVLESMKTGVGNEMLFSGDLKTLLQIGLLKKATPVFYEHKLLNKADFTKYLGIKQGFKQNFDVKNGSLLLKPMSRIESSLKKELKIGDSLVLELDMRYDVNKPISKTNTKITKTDKDPTKIKIGPKDPVSIEHLKIFGSNLIPNEGKKKKIIVKKTNIAPQPKSEMKEFGVFALIEHKGVARSEFPVKCKPLPGMWQKLRINIDSAGSLKAVNKIAFFNDNHGVAMGFKNIRIFSMKKSGYTPKHVLQLPKDAILTVDGIKVTRKSNKIDDLIDGITLKLKNPGKKSTLEIDHDYKIINKYIYEFIETYNKTVQYLTAVSKHLTKEDRAKLKRDMKNKTDLIRALEDKNKSDLDKHTGKLPGDMSISRLKTRLSIIMMSPYPTRLKRQLVLLMQMGISTGKAGKAKWADLRRNNGALELDTDILKKIIEKDIVAVSQIFGYDTNGDKIPDKGVGLAMHNYLKRFIQSGNSGVIAVKMKYYDRMIRDKRKSKERVARSVKSYEDRLRRKFTGMEQNIKRYKSQGRWLQNKLGN